MRALALALLVALLPLGASAAQPRHSDWDLETARTLPPGRLTVGVFAPLRWGVTESLELSTHPLWNLVVPNLAAKVALPGSLDWDVALEFGLSHPTPLLHLLSVEGTGGVLPADASIPDLLALDVHAFFTYRIARRQALTFRFGGRMVEAFGPRNFPTIDYPFVYGQTAPYVTGMGMDLQVAATGRLFGDFGYRADLTLYVIPRSDGPFTLEQSGAVFYELGERWRLKLGYKFVAAQMPYGFDVTPPMPLVDAEVAF